jgi:hypothetical protein
MITNFIKFGNLILNKNFIHKIEILPEMYKIHMRSNELTSFLVAGTGDLHTNYEIFKIIRCVEFDEIIKKI